MPEQIRFFSTETDVQVSGVVQSPSSHQPLAEVILLHGLEGSHQSGYMISMSHSLVQAGFRVTRLNMRTCGGTEHLCRTLYHAGLTSDLNALVTQSIQENQLSVFLVGFSLGGNVVLKYAGESGSALPQEVAGVVAISTPVDLDASCRHMMRLQTRIYERRFVARLKERYRRRCADHPDLYQAVDLEKVQSVYAFDDVVTAPFFGFGTAGNYYNTQSAVNFTGDINVPTLMIQAEDDPLIPFRIYSHPSIRKNPKIQALTTRHGGHVGFISLRKPRFWLDEVVPGWITRIHRGE